MQLKLAFQLGDEAIVNNLKMRRTKGVSLNDAHKVT